jgi:hypothetical protein
MRERVDQVVLDCAGTLTESLPRRDLSYFVGEVYLDATFSVILNML